MILPVIGPWLLAAGALAIMVEGVVLAVWTRRLAKGGQALAVMANTQRGLIQADIERLRTTIDETRRLWEPYRRILRRLRHPLVVAILASLRRNWAAH